MYYLGLARGADQGVAGCVRRTCHCFQASYWPVISGIVGQRAGIYGGEFGTVF